MTHVQERTIQAAALVRRRIYATAQTDVRRAPCALPTILAVERELADHFRVTETTARRYIRRAAALGEVEEVRCDAHWRVHLAGAGRPLYVNTAPQARDLFVIDTVHDWDPPLVQRPILISCRERTGRIVEYLKGAPQPRRDGR